MKLRYSMHPRHNSQTLVNLPAFRNAHLSSFHRFGGPFESDHNVPQYVRFMHSRQHRYHRLALALVKKESSSLDNSQARPLLEQLSGLLARAEGILQRENLVCSLLYLTYVKACSPGTFSGSIIRV